MARTRPSPEQLIGFVPLAVVAGLAIGAALSGLHSSSSVHEATHRAPGPTRSASPQSTLAVMRPGCPGPEITEVDGQGHDGRWSARPGAATRLSLTLRADTMDQPIKTARIVVMAPSTGGDVGGFPVTDVPGQLANVPATAVEASGTRSQLQARVTFEAPAAGRYPVFAYLVYEAGCPGDLSADRGEGTSAVPIGAIVAR